MDKLNLDHHISQRFNQELEEARKNLMQMGGIVEQQVRDAIKSIVDGDSELAEKVIQADKRVNKMEVKIDEECANIIARRHPAASDLRFVLAVTKSVNDLERMGDEASKIARMALELSGNEGSGPTKGFIEMRHIGEQVAKMVMEALDSFARLESASALAVLKADKDVDLEYTTAIRTLITYMMEDGRTISRVMNIVWALRSLERIGDHSRNIAEHVIYLVEGEDMRHQKIEKIEDKIQG
ncbi:MULTISPECIES: phosphate signaling complex protein PhoU [Gynuella]|uniref:Phosphate-specific transport system accessory protein PhoU n=1 Tax=Gynuella sunshinyii YC6258 TaxID=1445510 RepID=A0A0C5UY75_9GAMM|nr:phosphate signaling complex protein PhoU [Gynuella sunshinyii]AJQ92230.1 phosphate uptake regulator [Gynuella sunshinyii YC6258]